MIGITIASNRVVRTYRTKLCRVWSSVYAYYTIHIIMLCMIYTECVFTLIQIIARLLCLWNYFLRVRMESCCECCACLCGAFLSITRTFGSFGTFSGSILRKVIVTYKMEKDGIWEIHLGRFDTSV